MLTNKFYLHFKHRRVIAVKLNDTPMKQHLEVRLDLSKS